MIKDVEPLLKECEETLKELIGMGNMEVACYVKGFINSINKLPDADQRPHGGWIKGRWETLGALTEDYYNCSECGRETTWRTNYCSNCGADMRKSGEEK